MSSRSGLVLSRATGQRTSSSTRRTYLMQVAGNSANVKLTGMCANCPSAHLTLYLGVESALREEIPEFDTLRLVQGA